jgi:thioredoxin-related protein
MKWLLAALVLILFSMTQLGSDKVENSTDSFITPTNLTYFTVQELGPDAQLTWETNAEQKDSRIELQKSFNERQFETIAAFKGTGRNAARAYAYMDTTPFARTVHEVKTIYYRLKLVEANEIFTYSKVVAIARDDNNNAPKPVF